MHAAALKVDLRIPNSRSLKEKRRTLKSVVSMLNTKFPVAVAEVDYQDLWQRATLGVATVAPQAGQLERIIHSIERALEGLPDVEVLDVGVSYLGRPE